WRACSPAYPGAPSCCAAAFVRGGSQFARGLRLCERSTRRRALYGLLVPPRRLAGASPLARERVDREAETRRRAARRTGTGAFYHGARRATRAHRAQRRRSDSVCRGLLGADGALAERADGSL